MRVRHAGPFAASLGLPILLGIFAALVSAPNASAQDAEPDSSLRDWFSGELQLGVDTARSDSEGDIELEQVLRLKIDPPEHNRVHLRTTLWTIEDLDGSEDPTSTLRSISDASDSAVQTRLLSLYVEVDDIAGDSTLRIGRQRIVDGVVYNRIDGFYFGWRRARWQGYAFAGARASVYEDAHEDVSTGGGVSVRLHAKTRLNVDMFYGEDERRRFGTGQVETTLTSVSLRQVLGKQHSLSGRATWNDTKLDEVRVTAQGFFSGSEIVYSASYRKRLSTLSNRVTEVTQFTNVLGELNEFQDFLGTIDIPLSEKFSLGFDAQVHDAENTALASGNRDFQRAGASLDMFDLAGHYDASVILAFWNADQGEGQWTVTGEVSREWEGTEVTVGVDYDRFEDRISTFDPALQTVSFVEEHENIYSFYVDVKHEINEQHRIRVRAIFEHDDGPDSPYWRLRGDYTLRF